MLAISYLALQACLSFCSVSDTSGASLLLPCSQKDAVAHLLGEILGVPGFAVMLCTNMLQVQKLMGGKPCWILLDLHAGSPRNCWERACEDVPGHYATTC